MVFTLQTQSGTLVLPWCWSYCGRIGISRLFEGGRGGRRRYLRQHGESATLGCAEELSHDSRLTTIFAPVYLTVSVRGVTLRPAVCTRRVVVSQAICARYRGHGTDLSKVPEFQRHEKDSGSPESQVARLSARVVQLTEHLREHKTDYSTRRGLMAILSKRKQLLKYLRSNDKAAYDRCIEGLGIRQIK